MLKTSNIQTTQVFKNIIRTTGQQHQDNRNKRNTQPTTDISTMATSGWTTVGKNGRSSQKSGYSKPKGRYSKPKGSYKMKKAVHQDHRFKGQEPEWAKRNRLARDEHINPFTGRQFATAQQLADDLYNNNFKTKEEATLIAGIKGTIKCKKTGKFFTSEYKWRQHRVGQGLCPMAYCRCNCGTTGKLVTHLMDKHRKSLETARKMCFLKGPAVSQGFVAPAKPCNNPLSSLLKAMQKGASAAAMARVGQPLDKSVEAALVQQHKAVDAAKQKVVDYIKSRHKRVVDPSKFSLKNLEALKTKLDKELE